MRLYAGVSPGWEVHAGVLTSHRRTPTWLKGSQLSLPRVDERLWVSCSTYQGHHTAATPLGLRCRMVLLIASAIMFFRVHAWGVDTMTAPERLRRWEMLSWASPVPGGMSMTRTSRAPQLTLLMKVSIALITMGPRHTAALSSCTQSWGWHGDF